jgi:hypothetical protein
MTEKTGRAARAAAEQPQPEATPALDRVTISPGEITAGEVPPTEGEATESPPAQEPKFISSPDYKGADLVDRLQARHLPKGQAALSATEIVKRRKLSFDIDGVDCEPDMFVDEEGNYITFNVTLRSLSSAQEIEALRGIKDGTMAPFVMCRYSLYAINGKVLSENQRDFYWECLGSVGRQICLAGFNGLGAASEGAMGKFLSTRSED